VTVDAVLAALDAAARELGAQLDVDGAALMHERADILRIAPAGTISAGGTARLLRAGDGRWVAVNLARRSDADLVPALMARPLDGPVWDAVGDHLTRVSADAAVERAQLLGIPAAVAVPAAASPSPVRVQSGHPVRRREAPLVVDVSALWAGPLAGRLLEGLGASVVKVELPGRPDGARAGHPEFWARLNGAKEQRTLDVPALARLLDTADAVITSARKRALEQLDLDLERRVRRDGLVWIAITGYGLTDAWRDRVAFGDDAAVAGGLAVAAGGTDAPVFAGDAPADPLAGLHAAATARKVLETGQAAVIDVAMRDAIAGALLDPQYAAQRVKEFV
jgi:hypothetical protein